MAGLLMGAGAVAWTRQPNHIESAMWMTILVLQAVPYLAAVVCAGLSAAPEFRAQSRTRRGRRTVGTTAAPHLIATARAMSQVGR